MRMVIDSDQYQKLIDLDGQGKNPAEALGGWATKNLLIQLPICEINLLLQRFRVLLRRMESQINFILLNLKCSQVLV